MCDQRGCTCLLRFFGSKSFMRGVSASSITASSAEIPCHDVSVIGILWLLIRIFMTCVFHKGGYHILDYWAHCQALLWAAVEERCSPWINKLGCWFTSGPQKIPVWVLMFTEGQSAHKGPGFTCLEAVGRLFGELFMDFSFNSQSFCIASILVC